MRIRGQIPYLSVPYTLISIPHFCGGMQIPDRTTLVQTVIRYAERACVIPFYGSKFIWTLSLDSIFDSAVPVRGVEGEGRRIQQNGAIFPRVSVKLDERREWLTFLLDTGMENGYRKYMRNSISK